MAYTTHSGRITGPVSLFRGRGSRRSHSLCLVEQVDGRSVDIFWSESGDKTAAMSFEALEAAEEDGPLILLDV